MLRVEHLKAGYGELPVVHDISFSVEQGTLVALLGSNGSGKTTTLRSIMGLIKPMGGEILYENNRINGEPTYKMAGLGVSMVPEGRHLFGRLSVEDNLLMGAFHLKDKRMVQSKLEEVYALFPRVKERKKQQAETLSGGEQQMVAIARALMSNPKLLILDEPSLGLAPIIVKEVFDFIQTVKLQGLTVIIVEQNAAETLALAEYAYVIMNGETVIEGKGEDLLEDEEVRKAYLGM